MADFTFTTSSEQLGGKTALFVKISGELDASNVQQFEQRMRNILVGSPNRIIVELAGLHYISSAGIGVLLNTNRKMKEQGGRLFLVDVPAHFRRIFEVLGFAKVLHIADSLDEASRPGPGAST